MRYTSQGAPCPRHFYCHLKALIFEIKLLIFTISCAVDVQQKRKNKRKNYHEIIKNVLELHIKCKEKTHTHNKILLVEAGFN